MTSLMSNNQGFKPVNKLPIEMADEVIKDYYSIFAQVKATVLYINWPNISNYLKCFSF